MTARCVPEQPLFRSPAEERVWSVLRRKLADGALLMANVCFTGYDGDWEVDLLVGLPGSGFAAIEVKGGQVWHADGAWWQRTPQGVKALDLEAQAKSEKYLVARYLEKHRGWPHGRPRMVHLVALPDSTIPADGGSPGLPREWIVDRA